MNHPVLRRLEKGGAFILLGEKNGQFAAPSASRFAAVGVSARRYRWSEHALLSLELVRAAIDRSILHCYRWMQCAPLSMKLSCAAIDGAIPSQDEVRKHQTHCHHSITPRPILLWHDVRHLLLHARLHLQTLRQLQRVGSGLLQGGVRRQDGNTSVYWLQHWRVGPRTGFQKRGLGSWQRPRENPRCRV